MESPVLTSLPNLPDHRDALPELFSQGQWRRLSTRLGLSRRQAQIALRLASERTREQIAQELGITVETVRTHTRSLFTKLGVRSRVGLVLALVLEDRAMNQPQSTFTNLDSVSDVKTA